MALPTPPAALVNPPPMALWSRLAMLLDPPTMALLEPLAVLENPPATVLNSPLARLPFPPAIRHDVTYRHVEETPANRAASAACGVRGAAAYRAGNATRGVDRARRSPWQTPGRSPIRRHLRPCWRTPRPPSRSTSVTRFGRLVVESPDRYYPPARRRRRSSHRALTAVTLFTGLPPMTLGLIGVRFVAHHPAAVDAAGRARCCRWCRSTPVAPNALPLCTKAFAGPTLSVWQVTAAVRGDRANAAADRAGGAHSLAASNVGIRRTACRSW